MRNYDLSARRDLAASSRSHPRGDSAGSRRPHCQLQERHRHGTELQRKFFGFVASQRQGLSVRVEGRNNGHRHPEQQQVILNIVYLVV